MNESEKLPLIGQENQIQPLASTEMNEENSVSQQTENPVMSSLHHSCETLNLFSFKKIYCNGDYTYLIISGTPSIEELIEAWTEIVFEWAVLIRNENSEYIAELKKRIGLLEADILYIDYAITNIRMQIKYRCIDREVIDHINSIGYSLSYQPTEKELDLVTSLVKTRIFEHGELMDEYNSLNNITTGQKQTEDEFNITIAAVGKFIGYRINQKETFVTDFAADLNLLLKENAALKKQTA